MGCATRWTCATWGRSDSGGRRVRGLSGAVIAARHGALLALLAVTSFAPGFYFVRRLPWSPPEKLSGAIGLSLLLVYLAAFAIYVLGLPPESHFVVSALAAIFLVAARQDLVRLLRHPTVRR